MKNIIIFLALFLFSGCTTIISPSERHYNKGNEYYDLEMYDSAIAEYNKFLDAGIRSPKIIPAQLNLGMSYFYSKQYEKAVETLKGIRLNDASIKTYVDKVIKESELALGIEAPAEATAAGSIAISVVDASLDDFGSITIVGQTDKAASVTVDGVKTTRLRNNQFESTFSFDQGKPIIIEAKDNQGNFGELKYFTDREEPAAPESLQIINVTSNSVEFEWDANTEKDIYGYKIFYNLQGGSTQEVPDIVKDTRYEVVGLSNLVEGANKTFEFTVKAVDKMRNYSSSSDKLIVTLP